MSKGKAHKRYEFGQKIAVATTNRSNWIVASALMEGNPYDGHTLTEALTTVGRVTGVSAADAYVDKGFRGHGYAGMVAVHNAGQRKKNTTRAERKRRRRRSAIEPKIGHLKSDHRMGRCFFGDARGRRDQRGVGRRRVQPAKTAGVALPQGRAVCSCADPVVTKPDRPAPRPTSTLSCCRVDGFFRDE